MSVVGADAFMDFVESIQAEGVVFEHKAMGEGTEPKTPLVVETDNDNANKNIEALDIEIPILAPRIYREYKNLADLDISKMSFERVAYRQFSEQEQREIVFKDITTEEITHTIMLDSADLADYRNVIGYFARTVMQELRLVSGYDVLYGKMKDFIRDELFGETVMLEKPNTLRNLAEVPATKTAIEAFKQAINELTVRDKGKAMIKSVIKLRQTRPFVVKDQDYLRPEKSVFNRIIRDSQFKFELKFAKFLESCSDVVSHAKNYLAVNFKLDYINAAGDIANYYPDFLVKLADGRLVIVETKGQQNLDVPHKMARLKQWCADVNEIQDDIEYDFILVDDTSFNKYCTQLFSTLVASFRAYKA